MSEVKHTPAPWEADTMATYVFAGTMMVCQIRGWGHLIGTGGLNLPEDQALEIQKANARLIAAAPEMLALLKEAHREFIECADDCTGTPTENYFRSIAGRFDAAIAKATGVLG